MRRGTPAPRTAGAPIAASGSSWRPSCAPSATRCCRSGNRRLNVYLAAPLFTDAERTFNLQLTRALEQAGHRVHLPQRDTPAGAGPGRTRRLFEANLAGLTRAGAVVAVLDGAQVDDGTAWEIGWARARGIPVYGLRTDQRVSQQPDEPVNLMILESLRRLCTSVDELLAALAV